MLEIRDIYKNYEGKPLLEGISFTVQAGETVCLLGESGSGKSTLLRVIAGLETAESGSIWWNGEEISSVPAHKRGFGLMFQDYALFPHRTVEENVAFGLRMQGLPAPQIAGRVQEMLSLVVLEGLSYAQAAEVLETPIGTIMSRIARARAALSKALRAESPQTSAGLATGAG